MKNHWLDNKKISIDTCRQIAARIWCDREYSHQVMDIDVCEEIAQILFKSANVKILKSTNFKI
jgi:hypothetical protein